MNRVKLYLAKRKMWSLPMTDQEFFDIVEDALDEVAYLLKKKEFKYVDIYELKYGFMGQDKLSQLYDNGYSLRTMEDGETYAEKELDEFQDYCKVKTLD